MTPLVLNAEQVRAALAGQRITLHLPVKPATCLVDGEKPSVEHWREMNFDVAWVDPGPSPAGNPGPYLKVPCDGPEYQHGAVHRVYAKWSVGEEAWVKEVAHYTGTWKPGTPKPAVIYHATDPPPWSRTRWTTWSSAKAMPQWASRLTVTVDEVQFTMEPLAIYVAVRRKA